MFLECLWCYCKFYSSAQYEAGVVFYSFFLDFSKFSFCQYPFTLSLAAKRFIMQKDSESQMIVMARVSDGCYIIMTGLRSLQCHRGHNRLSILEPKLYPSAKA